MDAASDTTMYKILTADGGGIRAVFSVSVLAAFVEIVGEPLGDYSDLIARPISSRGLAR